MGLEIYSTEQAVQIAYGHETIRFLSPRSFRTRYIVLLRNAGHREFLNEPVYECASRWPVNRQSRGGESQGKDRPAAVAGGSPGPYSG